MAARHVRMRAALLTHARVHRVGMGRFGSDERSEHGRTRVGSRVFIRRSGPRSATRSIPSRDLAVPLARRQRPRARPRADRKKRTYIQLTLRFMSMRYGWRPSGSSPAAAQDGNPARGRRIEPDFVNIANYYAILTTLGSHPPAGPLTAHDTRYCFYPSERFLPSQAQEMPVAGLGPRSIRNGEARVRRAGGRKRGCGGCREL